LGLGIAVGELAVPIVFRAAKHLPRRLRKAIYRYSPTHNKGVGVSALSVGIFTGNPLMIGAGAGLVISDAVKLANKDKRMAKEWSRAINGMPPISIERYDIPEWLPDAWKYRIIGDKFREIVGDDTFNHARQAWIPAGREHPAVFITARNIMRDYNLDGHNKLAVLGAIQNWIQNNINYSYDARFLDQFVHPYLTLLLGAGDCDDQTLLAVSLGESLGIEMEAKLIGQDSETPTRRNHVFSQGIINGRRIPIETIFKGVPMGWEPPFVASTIVKFE
jgi:hypothetical protein